jgi:hypothetical protein
MTGRSGPNPLVDAVRAKSPEQRIKQLEQTIEQLLRQLDDARNVKFSIPFNRPAKGKKPKSFSRVCFGDTHGANLHKPAWQAFVKDLEKIQPSEIIVGGDLIDCGGFLAQHHTTNYVAQTTYTFEDDCRAGNEILDTLHRVCPHAEIYYLEGNHERRIETFCATATVRNPSDAKFLHSMFSTSVVLHLDKRKIRFFPQGKFYDGLSIPSIIKLGKCHFTHGIFTNTNAAKSHVDAYVCNIIYQHTHRADSYTRRTVDDTYSAHNPGCLCEPQQYWNHSRNTHHTHGYGLQCVVADGSFLHINVPIIGGKSYLEPLASHL